MKDRDIKLSRSHLEADPAHIVRGIVRRGLKPFSAKQAISLRIDPSVLEWFRAQGDGWQTRMSAVLKAYMEEASQSRKTSNPGGRAPKRRAA
jgi:uncharacterized protein (DUF4415 family)